MKAYTIAAAAVALLAGSIAGFILLRPIPPAVARGDVAKLYGGEISESTYVADVDLTPVAEIVSRSRWRHSNPIMKGSLPLVLGSGEIIDISFYGGFFLRRGTWGFFEVPDSDRAAWDAFCHSAIYEAMKAWNQRKTANQALQTTPMTRSGFEKTTEFGRHQRGV